MSAALHRLHNMTECYFRASRLNVTPCLQDGLRALLPNVNVSFGQSGNGLGNNLGSAGMGNNLGNNLGSGGLSNNLGSSGLSNNLGSGGLGNNLGNALGNSLGGHGLGGLGGPSTSQAGLGGHFGLQGGLGGGASFQQGNYQERQQLANQTGTSGEQQ